MPVSMTNKNLFTSGLCGYMVQFGRPTRSDRWLERMEKEREGGSVLSVQLDDDDDDDEG